MILDETYTLANGVEIPKLGLGTWLIDDQNVRVAARKAIECGYKMIDTAQAYDNEIGVGEGIKDSGIARDQLFVTDKVMAEFKSYESATKSIDDSLKKLQMDYVDLMIIHCPQPWDQFRGEDRYFEQNRDVWRALEDAYKAGKCRAIGVSNFLVDDFQNILDHCEVKPMVNQILCHAGNTPFDLIDFCKREGALVEAYSPVAHGAALHIKTLEEMAEKYKVSVAQICIRYLLQLGLVALPKTQSEGHMKENADVDFEISDEDMETLKLIPEVTDYGHDSFYPCYTQAHSALK